MKHSAIVGRYFNLLLKIILFVSAASGAQSQTMTQYSKTPPFTDVRQVPMVMLTLSSDHQVFIKAYNDYDDLDGDGTIESTFKPTLEYVGYFDFKKCYNYDAGVFTVADNVNASQSSVAVKNDDGTTKTVLQSNHYCDGTKGKWSGNFLNWVSMTRIDIVRLTLYGGYRSTDEESKTVLERSYLPQDAHSFAKYYKGKDIEKLIDVPANMACSPLKDVNNKEIVDADGNNSCVGYTFCNTSKPDATFTDFSQKIITEDIPPLLRLVKGNYSFWATGERYQCLAKNKAGERASGELQDIISDPFWAGVNGAIDPKDKTKAVPALGLPIYPDVPVIGDLKDFIVRVVACGPGYESGAKNCKNYGVGQPKPVGLLQENNEVQFGLMTKGFKTNKEFGVLRKNVSSFTQEIAANGTFVARPINKDLFDNQPPEDSESIIGSLNALRLVDYRFKSDKNNINRSGTYFFNDNDCSWGMNFFINGACKNWGNPFSEIMMESYRYFATAPKSSVNRDDLALKDINFVPGLTMAKWNSPTRRETLQELSDLACVNMSVLGFNAAAVSYDGDYLADKKTEQIGIGAAVDSQLISDLVDRVGDGEMVKDSKYFVGKADVTAEANAEDGYCTAKTIGKLSNVRGTCPDGPRLGGSYFVAGLSNFVYTHDMLPKANGINTITTFGVNLAGALPKIEAVDPAKQSKKITILPACHNSTIKSKTKDDKFGGNTDEGGNCAIIDFKLLTDPSKRSSGTYFVSYENGEQGGDYDQDINGLIRYEIKDGVIIVDTKITGVTGPDALQFGFIISGTGTDQDSSYLFSTVANNAIDKTCTPANTGRGCEAIAVGGWQRKSITLGASAGGDLAGKFLEAPLYYAAKWGSFDRGKIVNKTTFEKTSPGANEKLGYISVTNPSELSKRLDDLFKELKARTGAGSAAGISAGSVTGEGMVARSLYHPQFDGPNNTTVNWVGRMDGLFVDADGRLREDFDANGLLTNSDPIVNFFYNKETKNTYFYRYALDSKGAEIKDNKIYTLDELKPIWSARDNLAKIPDDVITVQRAYDSELAGRYIFTWIDKSSKDGQGKVVPSDGVVIKSEIKAFDSLNVEDVDVDSTFADLLSVPVGEASKLVNYIRGQEGISGYRSRSIDWGKGTMPWRLGDIVHSTAAIVGRPSAGFDTVYGDETYAEYREQYRNRRQMVYVGANDGMLHAFNAGFVGSKEYSLGGNTLNAFAYLTTLSKDSTPALRDKEVAPKAHDLGKEMWAYVPYNLLPHLKWLKEPSYSHVYYVDSSVQTFDVNIFKEDDPKHPNGWGTIIVAGMRFGGGSYPLALTDKTTRTLRSAYIVMDVTDPESPPELIAELTDQDMGFTIGNVQVVKRRIRSAGSYVTTKDLNDWYLILGSGPQGVGGLNDGTSDRPAKLYYVNLNSLAKRASAPMNKVEAMRNVDADFSENSHIGGFAAKDWDGNFVDDMLYFGTVGGDRNLSQFKGQLLRAPIKFNETLFEPYRTAGGILPLLKNGETPTNLPFSVAPLAVRDRNNTFWVFAGTGRFLVRKDLEAVDANKYFGLKVNDPANKTKWLDSDTSISPISIDDIRNVTNTDVTIDSNKQKTVDGKSLDDYLTEWNSSKQQGWYRNLSGAGEMNFTESVLSEYALLFTSYTPGFDQCQISGSSRLHILDPFSGLAAYKLAVIRYSGDGKAPEGNKTKTINSSENLDGMAFGPAVIGSKAIIGNTQGVLKTEDVSSERQTPTRNAWREVPLD